MVVDLSDDERDRNAEREKGGKRAEPECPAGRADRPKPVVSGDDRQEIRHPDFTRHHRKHNKKNNDIRPVFELS